MNHPAFAFTDLLASLILLSILALFSIAATVNLDNARTRVKCASNLRMIGQGLLLYSNDSKGSYPRTKYDPNTADHPTAYTAVDNPNPFAPDCPEINDVSGALYLLLRTEDITSSVFICPATTDKPFNLGGGGNLTLQHSNFPSGKNLSYSYANPYPSADALARGYKMDQTLDPTFAIAGDMNPGSSELTQLTLTSPSQQMRAGNSPNHSGDGQNILYADGHVEFDNNPFVGVNRDNVYTYGQSGQNPDSQKPLPTGGAGIVGSPVAPTDTILLPAAIMPTSTAIAATPPAPPANPSPPIAITPVDQGTDFTLYLALASLIFLVLLLATLAIVITRSKNSRKLP